MTDSTVIVDTSFEVGRMVNVKARTWPGINKPGGIAKVINVHILENTVICVDVRYTLGGRETKVPVKYVVLAPQYENFHNETKLRDRSILLGRCKRCGSLRMDCHSCDWMSEENQFTGAIITQRGYRNQTNTTRHVAIGSFLTREEGVNDSSSSSDESILRLKQQQQQQQQQQNTPNGPKEMTQLLKNSSDSSENEILANIIRRNRRQQNTETESKQNLSPVPRRRIFSRFNLAEPREQSPDVTPYASETESLDKSHQLSILQDDDLIGTQELSPLRSSPLIVPYTPPRESLVSAGTIPDPQHHACNDLAGFIQPEGDAFELPDDIDDMTHGLSFWELHTFFQKQLEHLRDDVSEGRIQVASLKRRLRNAKVESEAELERECESLHQSLLDQLLRKGSDQCRNASRKMKRLYRNERKNLTSEQRRDFRKEMQDFELDQLSQEADTLVTETWHMYRSCLAIRQQGSDADVSFSDLDESSEAYSDDLDGQTHGIVDRISSNRLIGYDFDPHKHATTVKKKNNRDCSRLVRKTRSRMERRKAEKKKQKMFDRKASTRDVTAQLVLERKRVSQRVFSDDETGYSEQQKYQKLWKSSQHDRSVTTGLKSKDRMLPLAVAKIDSWASRRGDCLDLTKHPTVQGHQGEFSRERQWNGRPTANETGTLIHTNNSQFIDCDPCDLDLQTDKRSKKRRQPTINVSSATMTQPDRQDHQTLVPPLGDRSLQAFTTFIFKSLDRVISAPRSNVTIPTGTRCDHEINFRRLEPNELIPVNKLTELYNLADSNAFDNEHSHRAFQLVVEIFQVLGARSLQEVIATEPTLLSAYENVIISTCQLMRKGAHNELSEEDGVLFLLFRSKQSSVFIEAITLQLIDSCYAMLHPVAWAMDNTSIHGAFVFDTLKKVCTEIVKCTAGMSFAAQLLKTKLGTQKWRKSLDGKRAFVSSINPSRFKCLLLTGSSNEDFTPSRLLMMGDRIPRYEIGVIWSILGLFSGCALHLTESQTHWWLLKRLFTSNAGVFTEKGAIMPTNDLVPSESRLVCCETELSYFSSLLSSNALHPLPQGDGFFMDIIGTSLLLQSMVEQPIPKETDENFDESYLMWSHSDPLELQSQISSDFLQKNILLLRPHSSIEHKCHELVIEYSNRLPTKKVRLSRFLKSLQLLENDLRAKGCADNLQAINDVQKDDFLCAFGTSVASTKIISPRTIFILEVTASLRLCTIKTLLNQRKKSGTIIFHESPFNKKLATELWDIIANIAMQHRKRAYDQPEIMPPCIYRGSLLQLNSAAKTVMRMILYHAEECEEGVFNFDFEYIEFNVQCLLTCLDCACATLPKGDNHSNQLSDEQEALTLIHCITTWLATALLLIRTQLVTSERQTNTDSSLRITAMCFQGAYFCLKSITNSWNREYIGITALRACLTMIRSCATVSIARQVQPQNIVATQHGTEEAVRHVHTGEIAFGNSDESAFLGLSVGTEISHSVPENLSTLAENVDAKLFLFLAELLVAAKVRKRKQICELTMKYADSDTTSQPSDLFAASSHSNPASCMSSAGKILVSRQSQSICACLAALSALQSTNNFDACSKFSFLIDLGFQCDVSDVSYLKSLKQCFYSEVCRLAGVHKECEKLIDRRRQDALCSFLTAVFDSAAIERFPSCDLERFKKLSSQRGYDKEKRRLQQANQAGCLVHVLRRNIDERVDAFGPTYIATNIWAFGANLGCILSKDDTSPIWNEIGHYLSSATTSLTDMDSLSDVVCMEKEVFYRIKLGCSILLSVHRSDTLFGPPIDLDCINKMMVLTCIENLVAIADGLDYQNRTIVRASSSTMQSLTHKGAKLAVLQECYSQLTFCIMFVTCCRSNVYSDQLRDFINDVRDSLLGPILSLGSFDIHRGLNKILGRQVDTNFQDRNFTTLGNDAVFCCIRRSKEFVLSLCLSANPAGSMALISVLRNERLGIPIEDAALLIANAFVPRRRRLQSIPDKNNSLLSQAVDNFLNNFEQINNPDRSLLRHLLQITVEKAIAPKLQKDGISGKMKIGMLYVLIHMFQLSNEDQLSFFSSQLLCLVAKCIWCIVKATISLENLDESILCVALKASVGLCNQVIGDETIADSGSDRTILSWSTDISRHNRANEMHLDECANHTQLCAGFLCTFAELLSMLCKLIAYSGNDIHKMHGLRMAFCQSDSFGQTQSRDISILVASMHELNRIEKLLFFDKANANPLVKNVYAKPKAIVEPVSCISGWTPSPMTCRAAKAFIAVFTAQDVV